MSIEAINEALELLRIAQSGMGPDPGYLDRYDRHHWDRISKCRDELEKLKQQDPAAFAILSDSGNAVRIWWSGAERARAERIAAEDFPGMPLVALYAAPVPAVSALTTTYPPG